MALVQETHGSQLTTASEITLFDSIAGANTPVNGSFQFSLEMHLMAAADGVTVRIYKQIVGDVASRVVYKQSFLGVQPTDDMIKVGPGQLAYNGYKVTITRDSGTDRTYLWVVESVS